MSGLLRYLAPLKLRGHFASFLALCTALWIGQPLAVLAQARGPARLPPRLQRLMELEEQKRQEQTLPAGPQSPAQIGRAHV